MPRRALPALSLTLSLVLAACASSGGGGDTSSDTRFTDDVGRITYESLYTALDKLLPKHGFDERRREEQFTSIYVETNWQPREPTEAERQRGIQGVRRRVIFRGRRSDGPLYRVRMEGEYEVRTAEVTQWHPAPVSDAFLQEMRSLASDMEMEVRTGVIG